MKYSDVLTKRADEREDATNTPQFQTAFNDFLSGDGKDYLSRVSPGEIMRVALGAAGGGGLGWLMSRLLHKKPKALRTLLYTLGGATAGGFGTHWYINRPGEDGLSIAQKLRREYAMTDPKVQQWITNLVKAKEQTPSIPKPQDSTPVLTPEQQAKLKTQIGNIPGVSSDTAEQIAGYVSDTIAGMTPRDKQEWVQAGIPALFTGYVGSRTGGYIENALLQNWRNHYSDRYAALAKKWNNYRAAQVSGGLEQLPYRPLRSFIPSTPTVDTSAYLPGMAPQPQGPGNAKRLLLNTGISLQNSGNSVLNLLTWARNKHRSAVTGRLPGVEGATTADFDILAKGLGPRRMANAFLSNKFSGQQPIVYDPQNKKLIVNPDLRIDERTPLRFRGGRVKGFVAGSIPGFAIGQWYNLRNRDRAWSAHENILSNATK